MEQLRLKELGYIPVSRFEYANHLPRQVGEQAQNFEPASPFARLLEVLAQRLFHLLP